MLVSYTYFIPLELKINKNQKKTKEKSKGRTNSRNRYLIGLGTNYSRVLKCILQMYLSSFLLNAK